MVRPLTFDEFQAFVRAGSAKDGQTHGVRDLNSCESYSAARAVNQKSFSGARLRALIQCVVGSTVGHPNSRSLSEANIRRQRMDLALKGQRIFRERASQ